MTDRIAELETRIAFLDQANQELSDALFRQQQELETLQRRLARLAERLDALEVRSGDGNPGEPPPPHY